MTHWWRWFCTLFHWLVLAFPARLLIEVEHDIVDLTLTRFISTPIALPLAPTLLAARNTSNPAPLPRSHTVSPYTLQDVLVRIDSPRFPACEY